MPKYFFVLIFILLTFEINAQLSENAKRAGQTIETLQQWYNPETGLWETTSWWNAANAIIALIDYSRITGSSQYLDIIDNTFEVCKKFEVPMPNPEDNWICTNFINDYYDDEGWWILAWIGAYDLTGDSKYLEMAKVTFADMATGWDDVCDGGVYWKKPKVGKSAIQNELFMLGAIRLHQRSPGNSQGFTYREWAIKTWEWFRDSGMINSDNLVENGLNKDCEVNVGNRFTYNQAMIMSALAELSVELKDHKLLELAENIAEAAMENLVYENGILKDKEEPNLNGDASQFKGIFMRHLGHLYSVTKSKKIKKFITKNAKSIWENAQNDEGEFGAIWVGPFDKADASRQSSVLDAFNAAILVNIKN